MLPTGLGIVAGIIGLAAFVPYFVSARRSQTRPNVCTWLIWSVVSAVLAASYMASGGWQTAWVPIGYAIGAITITTLVLRSGTGCLSQLEWLCLIGAAAGVVGWVISGDPMTALVMNLFVDLCGAIPMIRDVARTPSSESGAAWTLFLIANALNLLALHEFTTRLALYPIYLFGLSLVVTLLARRPRVRIGGGALTR